MKLKTVKSAKKRIVNITKNGKIIRRKMSAQHLVAGKSKRTRRSAVAETTLTKSFAKRVKQMVPYK
jgi:ribosomal protein L35